VIARFDPTISNAPNQQLSATNAVQRFAVRVQTPDVGILRFEIATPMELSLTIYNSIGEIVKSQPAQFYERGTHTVRLEIAALPSGPYFCVGHWKSEEYIPPSNCVFIVSD